MKRDQRPKTVGRYLTMPLALATALFMFPVAAMADDTVSSVEASAFGASANVTINRTWESLGPTPAASTPGTGGNDTDSATNVDLSVVLPLATLDVVDTGVLDVSATGSQVGTSDGETTSEEFCSAEDEHDDDVVTGAPSNKGAGFGALRIGGSASVGDGSPLPVVLNILILLVAAALGAVGGYAVHKFGLFDRMARLKGAGL